MAPTDPKEMPFKEMGDSTPLEGKTGSEVQQGVHQSQEVHPGVLTSGRASSSSNGPADGSASANSPLQLDAEIKIAMFSDHFAEKQPTTPEIAFTPAADNVNINVAPISPTNTSKAFSQKEQDTESGGSEEPPVPSPPAIEGVRLILLTLGLCLMIFLISLDRVIVTTAIPHITREFKSTRDIGWYGSAYMITACAFQPMYGRVYTMFSMKWTYLTSLFIFGAGSLLCAVSPNSVVLIIGRAIAGYGSAGLVTGSFVIVASAIHLPKRPIYTAAIGIIFGVGATLGPLIGGLFTDYVSWRWCFYINLPIGGATLLAFLLLFRVPEKDQEHRPYLQRIQSLDILGNALFLGASVMLFTVLELAADGEPWSSAQSIGLLVGFGVTAIIFIIWQSHRQDKALIPPRLVKQRTVAASCAIAITIYGALLLHTYFLPIWFQGILGTTAFKSGVNMLPYFIVNAFFSLGAGIFVSVVGYYVPPAIIGNVIATVGCGMLTTLSADTSKAMWAGYETLVAAGFGLAIQQGLTAVQTALQGDDVSMGTALVVASQSFGGAVLVSIGNNVFLNRVQEAGTSSATAGIDVKQIISAGATEFRNSLPPEAVEEFLDIYNDGLRTVFIAAVPLAGLAFLFSCVLPWKSVKSR